MKVKLKKIVMLVAIGGAVIVVFSMVLLISIIPRAAVVKEYDATKADLNEMENAKQFLIKGLGSLENIKEALPSKIEELNKKLSELEANPELKKAQEKTNGRTRAFVPLFVFGFALLMGSGLVSSFFGKTERKN